MGRCKSDNQCAYCAKLGAVENAEMLSLDALEGDVPTLWAVLTTRRATLDMRQFYKARELVMRALKRRWPEARYACLLEYTTGYGERSGGHRRPHWNLLIKGVPRHDWTAASWYIVTTWCRALDGGPGRCWAKPAGQYVDVIGSAEELRRVMRYVSLHFQKESQRPPEGFRGQRFNCSRSYFNGCSRATARNRARSSLRLKRELHKAIERGESAHDAELSAQLAVREAAATSWVLANERGVQLAGPVMHTRRGELFGVVAVGRRSLELAPWAWRRMLASWVAERDRPLRR